MRARAIKNVIGFSFLLGLLGCPGFGMNTADNGWLTGDPIACPTWEYPIREMMELYCDACHGSHSFDFRRYFFEIEEGETGVGKVGVFQHAEEILERIRVSAPEGKRMPPPYSDFPFLDQNEIKAFEDWIALGKPENEVDSACDER